VQGNIILRRSQFSLKANEERFGRGNLGKGEPGRYKKGCEPPCFRSRDGGTIGTKSPRRRRSGLLPWGEKKSALPAVSSSASAGEAQVISSRQAVVVLPPHKPGVSLGCPDFGELAGELEDAAVPEREVPVPTVVLCGYSRGGWEQGDE